MDDLEITKLCAEAMGLRLLHSESECVLMQSGSYYFIESGAYDPLHDDAQAMALVKRLIITIDRDHGIPTNWCASLYRYHSVYQVFDIDLNRAICRCVCNMQKGEA
jgi:hypothetical protein